MKRDFRLTRSKDFKRVRRNGKSLPHPLVVLLVAASDSPGVRIGVVASRSVGNAVARNRAKRRLRAAMLPFLPQIQPHHDLVLIARRATLSASFDALQGALQQLLQRAGVL